MDQQNIWMFWDNTSPGPRPVYLDICEELVFKHCGSKFNIYIINSDNIKSYISDIRQDWFNLLHVSSKADYIRIKLLDLYGGIWLDSDLIVMNDLSDILNKTTDFAATYPIDRDPSHPSNGIIASIRHGKTINKLLNMANIKMDQKCIQWGELGPQHLWEQLPNDYLSLVPELCMPIKYQDHAQFTEKRDIMKYYTKDMYCFMLYNSMFIKTKSRILNANREELLESEMLISQIFRKSFEICKV